MSVSTFVPTITLTTKPTFVKVGIEIKLDLSVFNDVLATYILPSPFADRRHFQKLKQCQ